MVTQGQTLCIRCKRAALLGSLLLLSAGFVGAAPYVYPYNTMTAAEVVQKLTTKPVSDGDYAARDAAFMYVAGIKDGTQGSLWCFQGNLKPDELTYEVAHALKARYGAAGLKANAGPLIVDELRRRYPCKPAQGAAR